MNLYLWFMRRYLLIIFLIQSSGGPFVQPSGTIYAILVERSKRNNSVNFDQRFRRRCLLKIFIIWSSAGPFIQQIGTNCAIFVEGNLKNNSVYLFQILDSGSGGDVV